MRTVMDDILRLFRRAGLRRERAWLRTRIADKQRYPYLYAAELRRWSARLIEVEKELADG